MRRIMVLIGLMLAPGVAFAAPQNIRELADLAIVYIDAGIGVAFGAAIAVYFYGIATAIPKLKASDSDRLKAHFVWGILALFIMFSVWGILALLRNTLFGGSGGYDIGSSGGSSSACASFEECVIGGGEASGGSRF